MSDQHGGPPHGLAARVRRVETLLEQRGLVNATELDRALEAFLARASPANGARVVARAWLDEGFRSRLLADASAALPELGLSMGGGIQEQRLKVVANTETTHNVIVCTLCSCYPIALLGPSPTWYKSESYRAEVGPGSPRRPARFRLRAGAGRRDQRVGLHRGKPVHGASRPARGHRRPRRGRPGRAGHPQRAHRRGPRLEGPVWKARLEGPV